MAAVISINKCVFGMKEVGICLKWVGFSLFSSPLMYYQAGSFMKDSRNSQIRLFAGKK